MLLWFELHICFPSSSPFHYDIPVGDGAGWVSCFSPILNTNELSFASCRKTFHRSNAQEGRVGKKISINVFVHLSETFRMKFSGTGYFSSVQSLSRVRLFVTPWTAACQASLSITNSQSLPKPMSIELVMPSNHLVLCCPLLLLPSIFPSIRVFSNESALHIRWPKYWHFSFNITPSNEHSGLISFRMDWLDLLAVRGTLKSLL